MYVAVKGGEKAIDNAHRWLAEVRRGDQAVSDLALDQIAEQLQSGVGSVDGNAAVLGQLTSVLMSFNAGFEVLPGTVAQ